MAQLHGAGPAAAPFATSEVGTTAQSNLAPGSRMRDVAGNEYVFVDYTGTVATGQPVAIGSDYSAEVIGATGRGPIGISMAGGTSDNTGWVQVYGRGRIVIGLAGVSPSDAANGPTTVHTAFRTQFALQTSISSPVGIGWTSGAPSDEDQGRYVVEGMFVATDASIGDVSDNLTSLGSTALIGSVGVWLNYPTVYLRTGTAASLS